METIKDQMKNLNMSANSYWQLRSYISVEMCLKFFCEHCDNDNHNLWHKLKTISFLKKCFLHQREWVRGWSHAGEALLPPPPSSFPATDPAAAAKQPEKPEKPDEKPRERSAQSAQGPRAVNIACAARISVIRTGYLCPTKTKSATRGILSTCNLWNSSQLELFPFSFDLDRDSFSWLRFFRQLFTFLQIIYWRCLSTAGPGEETTRELRNDDNWRRKTLIVEKSRIMVMIYVVDDDDDDDDNDDDVSKLWFEALCFGLRGCAAIIHMAVISWALQFQNHDDHFDENDDDDDDHDDDNDGWSTLQLSSWQWLEDIYTFYWDFLQFHWRQYLRFLREQIIYWCQKYLRSRLEETIQLFQIIQGFFEFMILRVNHVGMRFNKCVYTDSLHLIHPIKDSTEKCQILQERTGTNSFGTDPTQMIASSICKRRTQFSSTKGF